MLVGRLARRHAEFTEGSMEAVEKLNVVGDEKMMGHDLEALVKPPMDETGERFTSARSRVQASVRDAYASLSEASRQLSGQARAAARVTDQYVHDRPWQTVAVTAGIGFLLGYLLGRR
jgi:ElaB/YqjD/DUF883 family membrane-anchored ribosome-binding protein